jgi:hypothetical protein
VSFDPQPGLIVRVEPPAPIEELPPEQQLVGDNVTWIPGYWAWDDERNDFLWISGIWRNLPPGRQWIPGYWSGLGDGQYQWTSGYWADSASTEVTYIPTAPPRSLDIGPNIAASSDDQSWVPGNWVWAENRYLWRPGYWLPFRADWSWVPARYCWNRRGYVYVDGYWDYAVENRGVLFAPVYFNRPVYASPGYYYTPSIVIALNVFVDHLFVRPRWGHYYFGDYYASRYRADGYYASCSWDAGYRGYDPIYAHQRWRHRGDQLWESRRRADFDYFRDHEDVRPQHTWAAMRDGGRSRSNDGRNRMFATPLDSIARTPGEGGQRFRPLDQGRREQFVSQSREIRQFGQARHQAEARGRDSGTDSSRTVVREKLSRSPVIGRPAERLASREAPPRRPEARGTDLRVNPATMARPQPGTVLTDTTRQPAGRQSSATGRVDARGPAAGTSPAGANRNGGGPNALRQAPGRQTDAGTPPRQQPIPGQRPGSAAESTRQPQTQVTPQRNIQPQTSIRQAPQRQAQPAPQRQVVPQAPTRQAPQRQVVPQAPTRQAPQRQVVPQAPTRQVPQRQVVPQAPTRQAPQRQLQPAPQRQVMPQAPTRQAPQRQAQAAPQRRVMPQAPTRQAPQRQVMPQAPTRQAPQRHLQSAPQRQALPQAPARSAPQRQALPQAPTRQAPQRQAQAAPQRQVMPQAPTRQAPQRQVQPAPQRHAQPGSQSPPTPGREQMRERSRR